MAFLFVVEGGIAKPNVETLLIEPFSTIWERDLTLSKDRALKEFTYIELMSSKKATNPYAGYSDDIRHTKLKELLFNEEWDIDALIEQGLIKIDSFQKEASSTYSYYMATLSAAEKLKTFLLNFDLEERNERTNAPIYKASDITRALMDTEKVLSNLNSVKNKVEQELFETTKTKGDKQINYFEK